jgi:hypothetical protein
VAEAAAVEAVVARDAVSIKALFRLYCGSFKALLRLF